jgi:excisionase family DNA binding protein
MKLIQIESITKDELIQIIRESVRAELNLVPTAEQANEKLLKPKDVCELLKISNGTLFTWKKEGKIPFRRMGRRIFFVEKDVVEAMKRINQNS